MPQKFAFDADDEQSSGSESLSEPPFVAQNKQNNSTDSDNNQQKWTTKKLGTKPSATLKSSIQYHNNKNHHYKTRIPDNPISSDLGVESVKLKQQMLLIDKGYKKIFPPQIPMLLKNPSMIAQFIISQQLDVKVRRILSLYLILFGENSCKFIFEKTDRIRIKKNMARSQNLQQQHLREEYLKNWFEWVINQSSISLRDPNEASQLLAYRRQDQLARILVSKSKFLDAELVSNLQDEQYQVNKRLSSQEIDLAFQCFSPHQTFKNEHWLIHVATMLWFGYQGCKQMIYQIFEEASIGDQNQFGIELFLLKLYHNIMPAKLQDFPRVKDPSLLPWYWYITEIYKNDIPNSSDHKYLLLHKLISLYDTTEINDDILKHKLFSRQMKSSFMKPKIVGKMITASAANIQQLQHRKDCSLATQIQRIKNLYENDQGLEILNEIRALLENQQEISKQQINIILAMVYRITSQPEVICGYQKSVTLQFYETLKALVELMKKKKLINQEIQNIYLFLGIRVGQLSFQALGQKAEDNLQKLISSCQEMESYEKFMKNSMFDKIKDSIQAQAAIKNNDKLYKSLQNLYSEDPHKLNIIAEICALK